MAVLAAAIGDDLADEYWAYVEANPTADQLHVLEGAAFVVGPRWSGRRSRRSASHTVLDGARETVDLEAGQSLELSLDAAQLGVLQGRAASPARSAWPRAGSQPIRAARPGARSRRHDQADGLAGHDRRSSRPGHGHADGHVRPTGRERLSPGHRPRAERPDAGRSVGRLGRARTRMACPFEGVVLPVRHVRAACLLLCRTHEARSRTATLRYYARVVTPGTYAWEPAIAASRSQDGMAAQTRAGTLTIR